MAPLPPPRLGRPRSRWRSRRRAMAELAVAPWPPRRLAMAPPPPFHGLPCRCALALAGSASAVPWPPCTRAMAYPAVAPWPSRRHAMAGSAAAAPWPSPPPLRLGRPEQRQPRRPPSMRIGKREREVRVRLDGYIREIFTEPLISVLEHIRGISVYYIPGYPFYFLNQTPAVKTATWLGAFSLRALPIKYFLKVL